MAAGSGPLVRRLGPLEVECRPAEGGRLARLRYHGVDLVLPPGRVADFYGDTVWPSPQSLFDWPPPAVLDAQPYEVLTDSPDEIVMRSGPDHEFGLQVGKRLRLGEDRVTFEFTMANVWDRPHALAPWQVTRGPRVGLLVWAAGEPFTDEDRVVKQREDPGCWYVHARAVDFPGLTTELGHAALAVRDVDRICKLFTDARGWLAHVHDSTLFLRVFPDLAPGQCAPRQAELELYFNPERDYIELENQGPYQELAPGGSLRYTTQWRFARIDPAIPDDRVTQPLVDAVERLLAEPLDRG